jgi:hypothetical protein
MRRTIGDRAHHDGDTGVVGNANAIVPTMDKPSNSLMPPFAVSRRASGHAKNNWQTLA